MYFPHHSLMCVFCFTLMLLCAGSLSFSVSDVSHLLVCVCWCFCVTFMPLCVCSATVRFHKIHAKKCVTQENPSHDETKHSLPSCNPKFARKIHDGSPSFGQEQELFTCDLLSLHMTLKARRRRRRYDQQDVCVYPGDGNSRKILTRTDDCVDEEKYHGKGMI